MRREVTYVFGLRPFREDAPQRTSQPDVTPIYGRRRDLVHIRRCGSRDRNPGHITVTVVRGHRIGNDLVRSFPCEASGLAVALARIRDGIRAMVRRNLLANSHDILTLIPTFP